MQRTKIMLLGLLAVMALSSVVSATASAAPVGPWFRTPEAGGNQKQVKIGYNQEKEIKAKNVAGTAFTLKGKIAGVTGLIICNKVSAAGNIWNGLFQGEDNTEVKFTECSTKLCPPEDGEVIVEAVKAFSELQWKYAGNQKELTVEGKENQQKIYDVFAPTEEPVQKGTVLRSVFTNITLPEKCIKSEKLPVEAVGSEANFIDQHQVGHRIVWGTAAQVEPQNEDVKAGLLTWKFPNVTELHHQGGQTKAKLQLAGAPAELEGSIEVERNNGELYGAYNE